MAAAKTARSVGSSRLTIAAVAKAAQVSKGGVLYHFPTKHALLAGLLDYSIMQLETRTQQQERRLDGKHKRIRSFILAAQQSTPENRTLPLSVLTAAGEDKVLLEPMQQVSQSWWDSVEKESELGLILLLAVEGLQFMELLDLVKLNPKRRQKLLEHMLTIAERSGGPVGAGND
jgi:AcrR family transcriptional regulator